MTISRDALILATMPEEAKAYLLRIAFMGEPVAKDVYVGLALKPSGAPTLEKLTKAEPRGEGYKRVKFTVGDWTIRGTTVMSKEAEFNNTGQGLWSEVDISFLATGAGARGILMAWAYLRRTEEGKFPLRHFSTDLLHFPFRIRYL